MNPAPFILASASPRRAELLQQVVPEFEIVPSDAPEIHDEHLTAWEMAQVNAYRKARVVAKRRPDAIVLGGGLSNCGRLYTRIPARWTRHVFSDRVDTRLLPPRYGDSSGVRGAAWLWGD